MCRRSFLGFLLRIWWVLYRFFEVVLIQDGCSLDEGCCGLKGRVISGELFPSLFYSFSSLIRVAHRQRKALTPAFSNAAIRKLTSVFFDSAYKVLFPPSSLLLPPLILVFYVDESNLGCQDRRKHHNRKRHNSGRSNLDEPHLVRPPSSLPYPPPPLTPPPFPLVDTTQ